MPLRKRGVITILMVVSTMLMMMMIMTTRAMMSFLLDTFFLALLPSLSVADDDKDSSPTPSLSSSSSSLTASSSVSSEVAGGGGGREGGRMAPPFRYRVVLGFRNIDRLRRVRKRNGTHWNDIRFPSFAEFLFLLLRRASLNWPAKGTAIFFALFFTKRFDCLKKPT